MSIETVSKIKVELENVGNTSILLPEDIKVESKDNVDTNLEDYSIPNTLIKHESSDHDHVYNVQQGGKCQRIGNTMVRKLLKCTQCKYITYERPLLKKHVMIKHDPLCAEYKCNECSFASKYKQNIRRHMQIHSPLRPFQCDYGQCTFTTKYKQYLINHVKMHNCPEILICNKCKFCTFKPSNFNAHIKIHDPALIHRRNKAKLTYQCAECLFVTKYKRSLKKHAVIHQENRVKQTFQCGKCNYTSNSTRSFHSHMAKHDPFSVDYKCNDCPFTSKCKDYLARHTRKHGSSLQCYQCTFSTKYKSTMRRHMQRHNTVNIYQCEKCSYATFNKRNFTSHMQIHATLMPPEGFNCPYETKQKQYHDTLAPNLFKCDQCDYTTNLKNDLNNHLPVHSSKLKCSDTTKTELNLTHVDTHLNQHNPLTSLKSIDMSTYYNIEFKCIYCGYVTRNKDDYRNHVTTHQKS